MWRRPRLLPLSRRPRGVAEVHDAPSRAQSSSSSSSLTARRPLTFTLPDLTSYELNHVSSQLNLFSRLSPLHLRPTTHRSVVEHIRQHYYPKLMAQAKATTRQVNYFRANSLLVQRHAAALHQFGVPSGDLEAHPILLLRPLLKLPSAVHARYVLAAAAGSGSGQPPRLGDVAAAQQTMTMRGRAVLEVMDDVKRSLDVYGYDGGALLDTVDLTAGREQGITWTRLQSALIRAIGHAFLPEDQSTKAPLMHGLADKLTSNYRTIYDARSFLRNTHLLSSMLKLDLVDERTFHRLLTVCPLEALITLNNLYDCLNDGGGEEDAEGNIGQHISATQLLEMLSHPDCCHKITLQSPGFPYNVRQQLLRSIGFTRQEANEILLSSTKTFSETNNVRNKGHDRLNYTSASYVPEMQRRLQLLRQDPLLQSMSLSPDEEFQVVRKWHNLLDLMDGPAANKRIFVRGHAITFKEVAHQSRAECLPTLKYLKKYLNCANDKRLNSLTKALHFVPLSQVVECLAFIEGQGFSKAQMREVCPLFYFPVSVVEQKLIECKESLPQDEGGTWEQRVSEDDHILQEVLYLIERDLNFDPVEAACSSEKITSLSPAMLQEVDAYRRFQAGQKEAAEAEQEEAEQGNCPKTISNKSATPFLGAASATHLGQTSVRQLASWSQVGLSFGSPAC